MLKKTVVWARVPTDPGPFLTAHLKLFQKRTERENHCRSLTINEMSYTRRSRYSRSPSPSKSEDRSVSRSLSRSRSRSPDSSDAENPGNNLYVTGLSARVSKREIEKHFSSEGVVEDVHLVVDPWTRESRGFAFVTMSTLKDADRCIKYLDRSVLEGRVITVEKARRRRGRTPTPGKYLGLRTHGRQSRSYSSGSRSRSRSYSPYYSRRRRSYSPDDRRRSYSPYYSRGRSYSRYRSPSYSRSRYRSVSRDYTPDDRYYRSRRYRSISRSISPRYRRTSRRRYSPSPSPRRSRRSCSRSISPRYTNRSHYRSVTPSPRKSSRRSYSRSVSPKPSGILKRNDSHASREVSKSSKRSASGGPSGSHKRAYSRDSRSSRRHSRSPSGSSSSRPVTPESASP
ncbi:unnamed protein product [Fraxinus pennsylvanica]|uniref:RRM domain-containing protein n=1 Tax=Fraxinus pennsylvanica TaxID=56036 RepID=A0AAD2A0F5_9LAMI|nr:unnamed protein product [Fraxinus pennsylvanica]